MCVAVSAALSIGVSVTPAAAAELPSVTATFSVGDNPNSIDISPSGTRVVTSNRGANSVSVIDLSAGTVTTVAAGDTPQSVTITPDGSQAYVSNYLAGSVSVLDVTSATVVRTINVGSRPGKGAFTADGVTALVPNGGLGGNTISKINVASGIVTGTVRATVPGCLAASPDGVKFFVCQNTTLSIGLFQPSDSAVTSIAAGTGGTCTYGVFAPGGATLYTSCFFSNYVAQIDVATNTVTRNITVGSSPDAIAINPSGSRIFVLGRAAKTLSAIDSGGNIVSVISLAETPRYIALSNDGQYVLVATDEGSLIVLDSSGTQVLTTLSLGGAPSGMVVSKSGNFAAVSLSSTDQVAIINLPPAGSANNVPTAPMQQYAPAVGELCGDNPPQGVDWPGLIGARTKGWSTSWAQWLRNGLGGQVCSRQPYYLSGGTWGFK
ncbi:MAG: beta-propeller fold lactonase family protein [Actinomycetes bacterium]